MFVVAVLFELHPERAAEFRAAVLKNAAASIQTEEGCHRFDVCFSDDGTNCFLYELYTDAAAFDVHKSTAHFQEFSQHVPTCVANRRFESYQLPDNPHLK